MDLQKILEKYGAQFAENAIKADSDNVFVKDNLIALRDEGVYKALIPQKLSGHGVSYTELCYFLKDLAKFCSSTALTLSMHQHLVAVQVYKYLHGDPVEAMLKNVADKNLVLVSTGGGDWLSSNGEAKKVDGGYSINCVKFFCSGAELGNVAVMSCAYAESEGNEHVLHFPVPLNDPGVEIKKDWDAMGMRGTGSQTIAFKDVFVPEEKVVLKRPRGEWHPVWEAVCTFAHPLFMAPYLGIAEKIAGQAAQLYSGRAKQDPSAVATLGRMQNALEIARLAWEKSVTNAKNFDAKPDLATTNAALFAKTMIAQYGRQSAILAMEALGGYSYFRKVGIERMYRDLCAGEFHPMQAAKQEVAMGQFLLGLTPADI